LILHGLVLAGGRSSRMGRDKATLPWREGTLLDHMLGVLHAAGAARCIVAGDRDGYDAVPDRWPGRGPVGGLASAAAALPACRLMVVPVDMPLLDAGLLQPLVASVGRCAHWQAGTLPMVLTLDDASRVVLDRIVADPGPRCSLHAVAAALDAVVLPLDAAGERGLANANTPAQWSALRR
jgi:molybdopterin-guanine dinucleotide biosynthesis protein A